MLAGLDPVDGDGAFDDRDRLVGPPPGLELPGGGLGGLASRSHAASPSRPWRAYCSSGGKPSTGRTHLILSRPLPCRTFAARDTLCRLCRFGQPPQVRTSARLRLRSKPTSPSRTGPARAPRKLPPIAGSGMFRCRARRQSGATAQTFDRGDAKRPRRPETGPGRHSRQDCILRNAEPQVRPFCRHRLQSRLRHLPVRGAFSEADDGTRTHDLLHGKRS